MSTAESLEIKVIYSASGPGARKRAKTVSVRPAAHSIRWVPVGVLSVLIAGALTYATWWPANSFIYMTFAWTTPLPGVDADEAAAAMFPGLATDPRSAPDAALADGPVESPRFTGETAAKIIVVSGYTWLTLSTTAVCALALAAGTAFGRAGGAQARRIGIILAVGGALLLAWIAYDLLTEYGLGYPTSYLRAWIAALVGLAVLIGMVIGRGVRVWTRLAGITLILAGAGTATALYLGLQCGAVSAERFTPAVLALAFVGHSLWGWILLPLSYRRGR